MSYTPNNSQTGPSSSQRSQKQWSNGQQQPGQQGNVTNNYYGPSFHIHPHVPGNYAINVRFCLDGFPEQTFTASQQYYPRNGQAMPISYSQPSPTSATPTGGSFFGKK